MTQSPPPNLTPAMRQYLEAHEQVPDALLLIRMGDFYEIFFEDAVEAAQLLDITLTSRDKGSENPVPMCGVPHHALNTYVGRLLEAGRKVAICEQMEDPATAKGIVRREITRVVSPGVVLDPDSLSATENNYLASVCSGLSGLALAYVDASTGECRACRTDDLSQLRIELARVHPRELVVPAQQEELLAKLAPILPASFLHTAPEGLFQATTVRQALLDLLGETPEMELLLLQALGGLVGYLQTMQRSQPLQLQPPELYSIQEFMTLDETAVSDLELFKTLSKGEKRGALLHAIDATRTPMGGRLLRRWLAYPLIDTEAIQRRLDAVEALKGDTVRREEIRRRLKELHDMERLATRVVTLQAQPRELLSLARSAASLGEVRELLSGFSCSSLLRILSRLGEPPEPLAVSGETLQDPAPALFREGGIFAGGVHPELDELRELARGGKQWLAEYEGKQRELSGIPSLRIRYNKVFGYFLEVTRANLHLVPEHFIRKQTLVNAERYFTPELKEYEERVLHAEEKSNALEEEMYLALLSRVAEHRDVILETAAAVAELDVLAGLAQVAHQQEYVRPIVDFGDVIELLDNRHPVVEQMLPSGRFVPNDIRLDGETRQILLITGPNMAGKSTIMRQVALTVILAQMGSFVPARQATIGLVDRVFTRVGATDSLSQGLSTFMVEMKEAAEILKRATKRSLVILDEVGRGTSTYDGLSIAWSMTEYLHNFLRAKTLFATHYHELTQMTATHKRAVNVSVAVKEFNDEILFLHKLMDGAMSRSYGVQVARLAGVPRPVIDRAKAILASLEDGTGEISMERPRPQKKKRSADAGPDLFAPRAETPSPKGPGLDRLQRRLEALEPDALTPIQALHFLYELKKELQKSEESSGE